MKINISERTCSTVGAIYNPSIRRKKSNKNNVNHTILNEMENEKKKSYIKYSFSEKGKERNMSGYTEKDLLRLAKRFNNKKRSYLLVDPLQAKHMPVSPNKSLEMMKALGRKIADAYPETRLVIGFAETATAVGAAAASCISDDCIYIHTTREEMKGITDWTEFLEEHSHAAEQKMYSGSLKELFENTETVVFVDDEFSTGKTVLNIIDNLTERYPELGRKKLVAASVINRVSKENNDIMKESGVECISLLHLENKDYESAVAGIKAYETEKLQSDECGIEVCAGYPVPDTRLGVKMGDYTEKLNEICSDFINSHRLDIYGKVLVMGTEEFMYPPIVLGKMIEDMGIAEEVRCHATTRSPIAVSDEEDYPIRSGNIIHSFYEAERNTFIYNIEKYDTAIIFTDSDLSYKGGLDDLTMLLKQKGCTNILLIKGEEDVQHI